MINKEIYFSFSRSSSWSRCWLSSRWFPLSRQLSVLSSRLLKISRLIWRIIWSSSGLVSRRWLRNSVSNIKSFYNRFPFSPEEMHGGCDPRIFYNVHRPLLSGWRDNPDLPEGLIYEVTRYLDTSLNRCQPCLMSGSLRGAGPVVRGQRRPVCRHPAAGRWAGGGAQ